MIFIGLLTHQQKQAGFFLTQDDDFVYLFHRNNGRPKCLANFLYGTTTVKEIRDKAEIYRLKMTDKPTVTELIK